MLGNLNPERDNITCIPVLRVNKELIEEYTVMVRYILYVKTTYKLKQAGITF